MPSSLPYAGVGIRFAARFVDGLIFGIPVIVILALAVPNLLRTMASRGPALNSTFVLIAITFSLFYEVLMLRYYGATLGKMACGLKVVRGDGRNLGWGVSFGRYAMYNVVISAMPLVNWLLLLTTAIMAGTDEQSRGLHDRVCDTRVIYRRSAA
ncbi:MAG: RDD family protein [Terracidiphilus sp.]